MNAQQILLHIARGACLQSSKLEDLPLWIDRYAELLGCECRESAVAAAVELLQERLAEVEATCGRQAATIARTKCLVLSQQSETSMHYKNGREAKQGDRVFAMNNGTAISGILHDLKPGSSSCNGRLAATSQNDPYVTIGECLHADDIASAIASAKAPMQVGGSSKPE